MPADLSLQRAASDKRRYDLAGVGSLQAARWPSRGVAAATDSGVHLTFRAKGSEAVARDAFGESVGVSPAKCSPGEVAPITWRTTSYALRSENHEGRLTYALSLDGSDLAVIQAHGKGETAATVGVGDAPVDPGLLLFALWLAQRYRDQSLAPEVLTAPIGP